MANYGVRVFAENGSTVTTLGPEYRYTNQVITGSVTVSPGVFSPWITCAEANNTAKVAILINRSGYAEVLGATTIERQANRFRFKLDSLLTSQSVVYYAVRFG